MELIIPSSLLVREMRTVGAPILMVSAASTAQALESIKYHNSLPLTSVTKQTLFLFQRVACTQHSSTLGVDCSSVAKVNKVN